MKKTPMTQLFAAATAFDAVDSRDLPHFMTLAGEKLPALKAKGAEIVSLIRNRMMIQNSPVGDSYKNAGGLAMYMPTYGFDANYSRLALSKDGSWDEFMQWLNN